ncbi:stage V sporulation protein AA [Clostridia bacterium OttesenSCG-928-F22]|nr:stage V sporulation protein AA [Clostridia bacterium OttesenSCG-928-F22]
MIYLSMKEKAQVNKRSILLSDIAQVCGGDTIDANMQIAVMENQSKLVTVFDVILLLKEKYPQQEVSSIGAEETLVEIVKQPTPKYKLLLKTVFICIMLFFGSGMAIMNYHADVDMPTVHKNVYHFVTGEEGDTAYWISIPYSIGLAVGVLGFTKVWPFKQKSKEPNLLDLEFTNFEEEIIEYKKQQEKQQQNG